MVYLLKGIIFVPPQLIRFIELSLQFMRDMEL